MRSAWFVILVVTTVAGLTNWSCSRVVEVKAAALEDLIEPGLPGQVPAQVPFQQYAGYIITDAAAGRALFYYFVQAYSHPLSKPLTLWLNGGPGCSSVGVGAFEELGPFRPNGTARGLLLNQHSWNKASNILFVESPAGVGFSYSNTSSDLVTNDAKTAQDSLAFLLGWFEKFPEYKSCDFFLAGESYAGHYIPQLASLLLKYNDRHGSQVFNLKGVAIGNPLLNLAIDFYSRYIYLWSHGLLSDETFDGITATCTLEDYNATSPSNVSAACMNFTINASTEVGNFINKYDVLLDVCYERIAEQQIRLNKRVHNVSLGVDVCMDSEIKFYLNLPDVQKALHANTTHLQYSWTLCRSQTSWNYSNADLNIDMKPYLEDILNHGVYVWVYSGDLDFQIPLIGTRTIVSQVAARMNVAKTDAYRAWYNNGQVGGWTMSYANLTYATVRGAGHMVPTTQPSLALVLFKSFLSGQPLPRNKVATPN